MTTVVGAEMLRRRRLLSMTSSGAPCIPAHGQVSVTTPRVSLHLDRPGAGSLFSPRTFRAGILRSSPLRREGAKVAESPSRQALRDKVIAERRQAVGMTDGRDRPAVEIVREPVDGQADHFWDKRSGRSTLAGWLGVSVVFAGSLLVAFVVGFAAMYAYQALR